MNEVLNRFLCDKVKPILDKVNTTPQHPEQVLTRREGIELLTNCVLKEMVEAGTIAILEKDGEFYFEWKGDQNYVNTGSSSNKARGWLERRL